MYLYYAVVSVQIDKTLLLGVLLKKWCSKVITVLVNDTKSLSCKCKDIELRKKKVG